MSSREWICPDGKRHIMIDCRNSAEAEMLMAIRRQNARAQELA
jgi:hypothetical protein